MNWLWEIFLGRKCHFQSDRDENNRVIINRNHKIWVRQTVWQRTDSTVCDTCDESLTTPRWHGDSLLSFWLIQRHFRKKVEMRILVLAIFILTFSQQNYTANAAYPRKYRNRPIVNWNSKPFRKYNWLMITSLTFILEAILNQKVPERKETRINRWHRIRLGLLKKFGWINIILYII